MKKKTDSRPSPTSSPPETSPRPSHMPVKPITFSLHALEQLIRRGATEAEATAAILEGEKLPARLGRIAFRKNFSFLSEWKGRYYEVKQVMPIVSEEEDSIVVVTVYVFYSGGSV